MGFFYGEKYSPANRTFLRETGENFIEGTGHGVLVPWRKEKNKAGAICFEVTIQSKN